MHRIDYIEFTVADMARAKAFYANAFGWSFQDWGDSYASFNDGRLDGGLNLGSVQPGGVLIILYAEDLEGCLEGVVAAGGTVVKHIFSFPGGRRFEFSDTEGNVLAVWSDTGVPHAEPPAG